MKEILQKDLEMGNGGLQWFVKLCPYIHILFTIFFKVHDNFSAETWFLHIRILTDPVSYGRKYETLALFQDLKNASFTSHRQAMWYACYLYVCV